MIRVLFGAGATRPAAQIEHLGAVSVAALAERAGASVPFGCRLASCGTCRIEVLRGAELLDPPGDDERLVLELFGDDPTTHRLACQARLSGADGLLELEPAG